MKTNGKSSKGSKPYVPGGLPPTAKSKGPQGGRGRSRSSRPLFRYDNPDYSEIEWLNSIVPEQEQESSSTQKGASLVKIHGVAAAPDMLGIQAEEEAQDQMEEQQERAVVVIAKGLPEASLDKPPVQSDAGSEIRYSSALSVRAPESARLLPRHRLEEAPAASSASDAAGSAGAAVQHGTLPFAFRERSRVDLIIPLEKPFADSSYSFVCSMDVPFCHAVVRAKLNTEAVVTLIRTHEEGNARGRLDWIAAGSLVSMP